jgi:hypothetical protein
MRPSRRLFLRTGVGALSAAAIGARVQESNYTLKPEGVGQVLTAANGTPRVVYMTKKPDDPNFHANSTCCFHPFFTPSGERITDFAPGDHHHHRGIFLAWHAMTFRRKADFSRMGPLAPTHGFDINRGDFWGWGQFAPTNGRVIVNRSICLMRADERSAVLEIENDWTIDGRKRLGERLTAALREEGVANVLDLTYRLTPEWDLTLDHQAFGGFCVRARNDGKSAYADPHGAVTRPDPHYSAPDLNWPAADWYAYTIALTNGKSIGCAVVDHPSNPPSTWHNPRYVWMINPCIVSAKAVQIAQGNTLTLRYRVVGFDGPLPSNLIASLSTEWRQSS